MSRFPAVPVDFATVAPTMGVKELRVHYHAGWKTVVKWCAMAGVEPKPIASQRFEVPSDFAAVAIMLGQAKLVAHYGVSMTVVIRWVSEMPDDWKRTRRGNLRGVAKPAQRSAIAFKRGPSMHAKFDSERMRTTADLAAMHLQRRFVPVVRASIYGKQFAGLWQVGRLRMAETDMVALARKQGWAA